MRFSWFIGTILVGLAYSSLIEAREWPVLLPLKEPRKATTEEDVAKVESLIQRGVQERKAIIPLLKQRAASPPPNPFREGYVRSLQELSRWKGPWFPSLTRFCVGEIGFWRDTGFFTLETVKVKQIVDDKSMLVEELTRLKKNYWLEGFATRGVVDGDMVRVGCLLEITGTKQYTTVLGATKTVLVLEPYPIDTTLPERREKEIDSVKPEERQVGIAAPRQWTDATGKFKVNATFRGVIGGNVQLEREDGSKIGLPLEQLSNEDQQWIQNRNRDGGN